MRVKLPALILVFFILELMVMVGGSDVAPPCKATMPLLTGADGKPLWLKASQLLHQASHCEAPRFPALANVARIEGKVTLSILVDEKGEVSCIQFVTGHPLLVRFAIDAAKMWKFRPMTQGRKPVGFYGVLEFRFSTAGADGKNNSCLDARW
jgi:TonB family protein